MNVGYSVAIGRSRGNEEQIL